MKNTLSFLLISSLAFHILLSTIPPLTEARHLTPTVLDVESSGSMREEMINKVKKEKVGMGGPKPETPSPPEGATPFVPSRESFGNIESSVSSILREVINKVKKEKVGMGGPKPETPSPPKGATPFVSSRESFGNVESSASSILREIFYKVKKEKVGMGGPKPKTPSPPQGATPYVPSRESFGNVESLALSILRDVINKVKKEKVGMGGPKLKTPSPPEGATTYVPSRESFVQSLQDVESSTSSKLREVINKMKKEKVGIAGHPPVAPSPPTGSGSSEPSPYGVTPSPLQGSGSSKPSPFGPSRESFVQFLQNDILQTTTTLLSHVF